MGTVSFKCNRKILQEVFNVQEKNNKLNQSAGNKVTNKVTNLVCHIFKSQGEQIDKQTDLYFSPRVKKNR